MTFSITGFAYLLLTFGLGFFTWVFFQSWQKTEKEEGKTNKVGEWLFYFLSLFTLLSLVATIGSIFFSKDASILRGVVTITSLLLALGSAAGAYLISYLLFPKITPWYSFFGVFFLGLVTTILTILIPFEPFLENNGGINWDFPSPVSILRFSLYLITFLPLSIIFLRQFYILGTDEDIRIKSLVLTLIFSFGLIIAYIEFILESALRLPALTSDIFVIFLSIALLWCVFLPFLPAMRRHHKI